MPSISLVVPTYNVGRYLPDFLESLEAQAFDRSAVEVVFVNDGSLDDSAAIIEKWIARVDVDARIVTQHNGGLSAARNRGLDEIVGEWVSFPDPDDVLEPGYLQTVLRFLATDDGDKVHLMCTNLVFFDDLTGQTTGHPLRYRFDEGQRVVDLDRHPRFVHLSGASGFYRRDVLMQNNLRFDPRIRPNFEDGHLTALYLAVFDAPQVALLPDARYLYRRRDDGSSLVQGSWMRREKYVDLLRYGHLDLLERITAARGHVPLWAQNMVLYDLAYYFRTDARPNSPTASLTPEVSSQFHDLLGQILAYIDEDAIDDFQVTWTSADMRAAMLIGGKGVRARPERLALDRLDSARKVVRLQYFYSGDAPTEEFRARGFRVDPMFEKTRAVRFFGKNMFWHRTVWLPATGSLSARLDGRRMPLILASGDRPQFEIRPTQLWRRLAHSAPPLDSSTKQLSNRPRARLGRRGRLASAYAKGLTTNQGRKSAVDRNKERALRWYARTLGRAKYGEAWLLIDRDNQAQDNAEHLYRHLRTAQPDVNAWFVLSRSSSDWPRLEGEGFRLIPHKTWQHRAALMNCVHLISSQVDHYIVNPLPKRFGRPGWHYTFLQHGVTKDDLSTWLNGKSIDRMITATPDEHQSIVGFGSPYLLSDKEVSMTGFPRHDRLLRLAEQYDGPRRTLLVMPTWRRDLLLHQLTGGNDRALRADFWESSYAANWRLVLESSRVQEALAQHGWKMMFIPHPNMQGYLKTHPLPKSLDVRRFSDVDIQQVLAEAGAMITDYSSMAFEMAYIERPVVYYQFDQTEFFSGAHAYRRGEWSYEDNGFGPVTVDSQAAIDSTVQIIERGGEADQLYAERMHATFPHRDGECSRRTYESITELTRPFTYDELYQRRG